MTKLLGVLLSKVWGKFLCYIDKHSLKSKTMVTGLGMAKGYRECERCGEYYDKLPYWKEEVFIYPTRNNE